MRAITSCLAAAGRAAGTPLTLGPSRDAGWVQVEAGTATVACTIMAIEGIRGPVVLALATWPAAIRGPAGHAARSTGYGAQPPAGSPRASRPGCLWRGYFRRGARRARCVSRDHWISGDH